MRATVVDQFGAPDVLRLADLPEPEPGPGEVSIAVAYAGVNFADVMARRSGYRVAGLPFVPGLEVSGHVRALGPGVDSFRVGDPVVALTPQGGYAEVVVAPAVTVFALPARVDLRKGATMPSVLPTAHALIHEIGRLRYGESVLVHGAAGGVGTVVGQFARLAGAFTVYGVVSSPEKAEYARGHGYHRVYVGDGFADELLADTGGRGVDLVLDPVGGQTWRDSLRCLAVFGRLVSYGNASGEAPWQVGQGELMPGGRSVAGFSLLSLAAGDAAALRRLAARAFPRAAEGPVQLPVTAEFPLDQAAQAHRLIESRTSTGKLLLYVAGH